MVGKPNWCEKNWCKKSKIFGVTKNGVKMQNVSCQKIGVKMQKVCCKKNWCKKCKIVGVKNEKLLV